MPTDQLLGTVFTQVVLTATGTTLVTWSVSSCTFDLMDVDGPDIYTRCTWLSCSLPDDDVHIDAVFENDSGTILSLVTFLSHFVLFPEAHQILTSLSSLMFFFSLFIYFSECAEQEMVLWWACWTLFLVPISMSMTFRALMSKSLFFGSSSIMALKLFILVLITASSLPRFQVSPFLGSSLRFEATL